MPPASPGVVLTLDQEVRVLPEGLRDNVDADLVMPADPPHMGTDMRMPIFIWSSVLMRSRAACAMVIGEIPILIGEFVSIGDSGRVLTENSRIDIMPSV